MTPRERQVMQELTAACEAVVNNWERGNLAHAAHLCDEAAAFGREILEEDDTMAIHAQTTGEPAAGIRCEIVSMTFDRHVLDDDTDGQVRRNLRDLFGSLAAQLLDAQPRGIWLDDECPNCGRPLEDGHCTNGNCLARRIDAEGYE
jgi:hypothetical protein